jgi:hypothetical protein
MKEITKEMTKDFKIMKLGIDFMGYDVKRKESLSFHHLIIPHRESKKKGIGDGYLYWNGAILVQQTSHEYLHTIEKADPEIFYKITSEMIDENIKRKLDIENLKNIKELLLYFEREHKNEKNKKGKRLIKYEYTSNRFNWDR